MAAFVDSIDAPGSTGNVSYTGVGFQPMAVIFWGSLRTTAGATASAAYSGWYGMTDGTNAFVTGMSGAAPTSNSHYIFGDSSCVKMIDVAGTIIMEAEIVSLDSDGFTLNWTTAGLTGADVNFMAIAGANLTDVVVGTATVTASGDTVVTGLGFQPDMMYLNYYEGSAFPQAVLNGQNTIGLGVDDGTNRNGHAVCFRSSIIDAGNSWISGTNSLLTLTANNAPVSSGKGTISAFGADGFTINMSSHAGIDLHVGYLAMKGASNDVRDALAAGATGDQAETGAGFTPEVVFQLSTATQASQSEGADAGWEGSEIQIGASDGTRHRFGQFGCDVNGDGGCFQSTTHFIANVAVIDSVDNYGSLQDEATIGSLDADGYTINWSVYGAVADPRSLCWAFAAGGVIGTFDNKLIYADGISSV